MLTPDEVYAVKETYKLAEQKINDLAITFYGHLFECAPESRKLFADTDMAEQGKKLFRTIAVLASHADSLDSIKPELEYLGKRHVGYGVRVADYDIVGEALIWTFQQELGDAFTVAAGEAWQKLYGEAIKFIIAGHRA